jgi:DNA-binding NtrC family response regulator
VSPGNGAPGAGRTILVVDDEVNVREMLAEDLKGDGYEVLTAARGSDALRHLEERSVDAALLDLRLAGESGMDLLRQVRRESPATITIMITGHGGIADAIEATKLGCYQFYPKPLDHRQIKACLLGLFAGEQVRVERDALRELRNDYAGQPLIGQSPALAAVLETVRKVARSNSATVLIQGETGVGKELIAQRLHLESPRANGLFVELNCSAIPENLLESELFGHERGAFTDARRAKKGVFEHASGGTVFLDEIGEMSPALQAKLLRVLETRSFRRLGGLDEIQVDTRVLAATHRNLDRMVKEGKFREDLFYRFNVVPLFVPPLRERGDDVLLLARHFTTRFAREMGRPAPEIVPDTERLLAAYAWPGNVRELRNVMERISLLEDGPVILPEHLPPEIRAPARAEASLEAPVEKGRVLPLSELERRAILGALEATNGNKTQAATLLGISRQTLRSKLKDYSLEDRSGEEGEEE